MLEKIKNTILKIDRFLYKKFGSDKSVKILENIKEANIIFSKLNEIGKEPKVRFVGGCVRKSLCYDFIDDIDLATTLRPDEVKKILTINGIKVIETGIDHGTVTAVLNHKKFEITTLRQDVSTDGRHANIDFTTDWNKDALRRDFTINAIYADVEGRIYDPVKGTNDLSNGVVKFIGDPEERIKEDYLRILRYLRFFLKYSKNKHEGKTIQAIKNNIDGLNKISNERKFSELKKILQIKNILDMFSNKTSREVFLSIFPQLKYYSRLEKLKLLSSKTKNKIDELLILALLVVDKSDNCEYFCHKFKTSNKLRDRLLFIVKNFEGLEKKNFLSEKNIRKHLYYNEKKLVKDLLIFSYFINNRTDSFELEKSISYLYQCKKPEFPISGDYLIDHGYKKGEKLGMMLKKIEIEWVLSDFNLDKKKIIKMLKK